MSLVKPRPARPVPIRMTPLIDVVFILLVFFMLTTRLLPTSHLELDNSTARRGTATGEPRPELTLAANGDIRWAQRHWRLAELIPALKKAGVGEVNLQTSGGASLADFTLSLSQLTGAGIHARWKRTPAESGDS